MPSTAGMSEARAFAESVAGVLDRHAPDEGAWAPGQTAVPPSAELSARLDELGWSTLAGDPQLTACAGLGAVELGRRLAAVHHVDGLLPGGPAVGDLVRSLGGGRFAVVADAGSLVPRAVLSAEAVASAEGLEVRRVLAWGEVGDEPATGLDAWLAANVGYLAGLGQAALELTIGYVRRRSAFGRTLAALAPVQQLLAGAAATVRGVSLLAAEPPDGDALAHAGPAVAEACAACQQVTGALGFTLEYPLHRYTQRARALATWNDALLEGWVSLRRWPAADPGRV
jgi:butyryl-CoA dehydrogenase